MQSNHEIFYLQKYLHIWCIYSCNLQEMSLSRLSKWLQCQHCGRQGHPVEKCWRKQRIQYTCSKQVLSGIAPSEAAIVFSHLWGSLLCNWIWQLLPESTFKTFIFPCATEGTQNWSSSRVQFLLSLFLGLYVCQKECTEAGIYIFVCERYTVLT